MTVIFSFVHRFQTEMLPFDWDAFVVCFNFDILQNNKKKQTNKKVIRAAHEQFTR